MGTPYIGEIRMFAGTYAPAGWLLCQGQLLPISENETLFNLIGTTYGGDGQENFQLPNLGARFPLHAGAGPDGVTVSTGDQFGVDTVTLTTPQIPQHSHAALAGAAATTASASGAYPAAWADVPYSTAAPATALSPQQLAPVGGSQPHENRQPYLTVNFIISLTGIYPQQT